ncbi:MAG: ComEC/Rec2 family competence protein [Pirellulaceae bacterium]
MEGGDSRVPVCVEDISKPAAGRLVSAEERLFEFRARWDRRRPLLWVLVAAVIGICVDRWTACPLWAWFCFIVPSLFVGVGLVAARREACAALVLLGSVAALAGIWHHDRWNVYPADEISRFVDRTPVPVAVRVLVLDAPRHCPAGKGGALNTVTRKETTRYPVRALAVRQRSGWRPVSGRLRLIIEGEPAAREALRGDQLEVAALLAPLRAPLNPGEPDFASMCRGRRRGAVLLCEHSECVRPVYRARPWSLLRQLGRLRVEAERALDRHVGPERASLAAALLLGSRERLPQATIDRFFVSGILHFLAISGLHVGILATVFWVLLRLYWLPRHRILWAAGVVVVNYALLTGARPPVVRATVLILIYCTARGSGRFSQAWNSLAAAGLVTLALSPSGLFDTGTQLSFLAVACLICAWPMVTRTPFRSPLHQLMIQTRPIWARALRGTCARTGQLLLISTVVWSVSLPLVACRFHLVAPIGLILTVLLWLPLAAALFTALFTVLTAPLPFLPRLFGALCDTILSFLEWLTCWAAGCEWGHGWVAGPPWWWCVVFYVGLFSWRFTPLARLNGRRWIALLCGWVILWVACGSCATRIWRGATRQPLRVSFIAVGHGSSVLVELPDGKVLLYDAGRMGSPRAAVLPISSVLWARRIHHVDALVLSHADADHFNAVPQLLDRFSVGVVYVSPAMFDGQASGLKLLQEAINEAQVAWGELDETMTLRTETEVQVKVLHPPDDGGGRRGVRASDNSNSIVLELTHGRHRILLTGDIEGRGLDELLAELPVRSDVLLAPHHGSPRSRPADVTRWADPAVVVISAGSSRRIGQVESVYGARGADVFWTHRDGMMEAITDGRELQVSTWRGRPE